MERESKQGDVRVALLKQLGIADADLKLLLASTAAADSALISGGSGGSGLSAFRSFCRRVFDAVRGDAGRYVEFARADSDRERVRLAWSCVDSEAEQMLLRIPADETNREEAKLSSVKLRETGNLLYKSRRFPDAIASYSEAAVEAGKVPDVALVSAAVANRSAALFEAGSLAEAEEDAAAALDVYGYPEPQDGVRGRYTVAARNIGPGEILLVESKPAAWFLSWDKTSTNCQFCCGIIQKQRD